MPQVFGAIGCQTITIPTWTRTPRGRTLWELTRLPRHCRVDFDALLCVTPIAPPLACVPVVSVVHDLTPLVMHSAFPSKTKALFWSSLQTLRNARAVLTVSQHTRRDFIRLALVKPERVFVAYPGVQNGPGISPSRLGNEYQPFLLYVGSHKPNKNLGRLIAAFAGLEGHASLRLVIAGWDEPRYVANTRSTAARLGVKDRVVILSEGLRGADISGLYRTCEAFVHPALYEGFGSPLVEALAHGAPAACSRLSSLPEVAGDAALLFDPNSVEDMRQKIRHMLDDQSVRSRLRASGPARASLFSWQQTASVTSRVVDAVVRRTRLESRE